ncbi:MAG: hypothetical protein HYZ14_12650 [Bacteroidetes bacterium]|nr:hypothetical protein [Bacteroidota bacterium]
MRSISFIFLVVVFSAVATAKSGAWSPGYYELVSDRYDQSVEDGFFIIRGIVANTTSQQAIPQSTITNVKATHSCQTDVNGLFNLKIPVADTLVYCYAPGYDEVLIQGPFKNKHVVTVKVFLEEAVAVVFKPVIYAYNAGGNIHLRLKPRGTLTFTYPETATGDWDVRCNEDGTLTSAADGKNYPYLFWEGEQPGLKVAAVNGNIEGYLVKTDTCISFLENTLAAYGLNERETADFITFWGPKMIEKEFAFVQFLTTEQYGCTIASLDIEPQPESLLRLYLYLVPLAGEELPFDIKTPQIEPFNRNGFTVVEWGGSVLSPVINFN